MRNHSSTDPPDGQMLQQHVKGLRTTQLGGKDPSHKRTLGLPKGSLQIYLQLI